MKAILKGFVNLGNLFLIIGVITLWVVPKIIENGLYKATLTAAFVLILYLFYCSFTSNRANEYLKWQDCRVDIMGDIVRHSFYIIYPIIWGKIIRYHFSLPITKEQYYTILIFLILIFLISLWELAITVKNCLLAMERKNPITIQQS